MGIRKGVSQMRGTASLASCTRNMMNCAASCWKTQKLHQTSGGILYVIRRAEATVALLRFGDQTRVFKRRLDRSRKQFPFAFELFKNERQKNTAFSELSKCRKRCTFRGTSTNRCDANPKCVVITNCFICIKPTTLNFRRQLTTKRYLPHSYMIISMRFNFKEGRNLEIKMC